MDNERELKQKVRDLPIKGFVISLIIAAIVYFGLKALPRFTLDLFPNDVVVANAPNSLFYKVIWYIQDFTNAQFYASVLAGLGMVAGGIIAYLLNKRKSKLGGFTISYIMHLFPWILASQLLGLAVSVFVPGYVHLLQTLELGWVPTFIPFVSVPVIVIFVYGPSIRSLLTGSILSGLISTPIAVFIIKYILTPLGLPAVAANVFTMALVGIIVLETCRHLPWMVELEEDFFVNPGAYQPKYGEKEVDTYTNETSWFLRRVLSDFTEAQFYGNEWASGLMLVGLIVHYVLDYRGVYYGNDFVPLLLSASIVGSAVGVFLYRDMWKKGFFATFTPVVTIIPGVLLLVNGNILLTFISAIMGGIIAPPFANAINNHIPKGWHPMIGNTLSMSVCTIIIAMFVLALPV